MGKTTKTRISKRELAFRRSLRLQVLLDDYDLCVAGFNTDSHIKYSRGFDNMNLSPFSNVRYKKSSGWFRKVYLPKFNYILTDSWEDIEYKFAYNHYSLALYMVRHGDWVDISKYHDTIFYKPNYKQRDIEEIKKIRLSNKEFRCEYRFPVDAMKV